MLVPSHDRAFSRLQTFARVTGLFLIILGGLVLLGWAFDIEIFKRVFPMLVAMNPATAVAFILSGIALRQSGDDPANESLPIGARQSRRRLVKSCAAAIAMIGVLKLAAICFEWPGGIDQILFHNKLDASGKWPNLMAPNTALNFLLIGIALFFLDAETSSGRKPAEYFAITTALLSWLAVMGYAYNAPSLYGLSFYIPMALHSAIAFLLLSFAILCVRPKRGLMATIMSRSAGGYAARGILPAIFLFESALGWFRIMGEKKGFFAAEAGVSFMVVFGIALCSAVVLWSASSLNKTDAKRREAEDSLEAANARLEERVLQRTTELTLANAELKNEMAARQKTQQALATAEANFRKLVEQSLVGIYVLQDGKLAYVNPRMTEIFGYSAEEFASRPVLDFIAQSDHALVTARIRQRLEGVVPGAPYQLHMARKDGTKVDVEVHGATAEFRGQTAILGTLLDITERKQAENRIHLLNEELEKRVAERTDQLEMSNKELEAFSYSVSHDLRAPLRHVAGFVDLLRHEMGESISQKSARFLKIIADSAKQMGQLIDELLVFSRMSRIELQETEIDPNLIVEETITNLQSEINGRDIRWTKSLLPSLKADPALLRQVFVNLLSNAIKYTGPRTLAEIEIGHEEKENEIVIFIRDNGVGFDMKFADKLFGVFQRLHRSDEFEGTGVGLANVRRIIQRHGGRTWAEGKMDSGATFSFSLPKKSAKN